MSSESLYDERTVWVGNVPAGYGEAEVRAELRRHNIESPYAIKVCTSHRNNPYAFLSYKSKKSVKRLLMLGESAVVWEKTKKYGFFKVFFLRIHSRCCVSLASEQCTGD